MQNVSQYVHNFLALHLLFINIIHQNHSWPHQISHLLIAVMHGYSYFQFLEIPFLQQRFVFNMDNIMLSFATSALPNITTNSFLTFKQKKKINQGAVFNQISLITDNITQEVRAGKPFSPSNNLVSYLMLRSLTPIFQDIYSPIHL